MSEFVYQRIESQSSIEIIKNSKAFNYTVKAYGSTEVEIQTKLKNLVETAKSIIKELETP